MDWSVVVVPHTKLQCCALEQYTLVIPRSRFCCHTLTLCSTPFFLSSQLLFSRDGVLTSFTSCPQTLQLFLASKLLSRLSIVLVWMRSSAFWLYLYYSTEFKIVLYRKVDLKHFCGNVSLSLFPRIRQLSTSTITLCGQLFLFLTILSFSAPCNVFEMVHCTE